MKLYLETQCANTVAFVVCLVLFEEKLRDDDDWNYIKLLDFSNFRIKHWNCWKIEKCDIRYYEFPKLILQDTKGTEFHMENSKN